MRRGFTLLETLIALVVASILFGAIFRLTQMSLQQGRAFIRCQIDLHRELAAINDYDERRLIGQEPNVPTFLLNPRKSSWGVTGESPLGYRGVLLP